MTAPAAARSGPRLLAGLVRASHPEPTVAATALTTVVAIAVPMPAARVALVAVAVLSGQLSIGWSNDALDAARDRAAGRADKPVVTGAVDERLLLRAACAAVAVTVVASLCTGWRPGATHLLVVGSGWAYNAGLKRTPASFVPYAVAFGVLPLFAVLASDLPVGSRWWLVLAGALLGVGAHLFNVLPDLDDDRATGVRGLPVRLGATATRVGGSGLLLAAAAVLVAGPPGSPSGWAWAGLAVAAALSLAAGLLPPAPGSRAPFLLALVVAAVDVALLAGGSSALG